MEKREYNRYRILKFIHKKKLITRSSLTINGLNRFPMFTMKTLYAEVDALVQAGYLRYFIGHMLGKRGPAPTIYEVTAEGAAWLKACEKESKKLKQALK